jgi:hypothetical protein
VRRGFSPLCSKLCSGNQSHPINPINSLIMHSSAPIPAPVLRWSWLVHRHATTRDAPVSPCSENKNGSGDEGPYFFCVCASVRGSRATFKDDDNEKIMQSSQIWDTKRALHTRLPRAPPAGRGFDVTASLLALLRSTSRRRRAPVWSR